jgi:ADP-heptose:LPS heptosyltransferase
MNLKLLKYRLRILFTGIIKLAIQLTGTLLIGSLIRLNRSKFTPSTDANLKILYVCLSFRGDLILNFPAILAIKRRFPNAIITCWTWAYNENLAKLNENIDNTIVFEEISKTGIAMIWQIMRLRRRNPFIKYIRENKFDISIDDSGYGFSSTVSFLAGIPLRIGRNVQGFGFFNHFEFPYDNNSHLLEKRLILLKPLGILAQNSEKLIPSISIPPGKVSEVKQKYGLNIELSSYFTVQPYGGWSSKNWDDIKFSEVIGRFALTSGLTPVFIGGPGDAAKISRLGDNINFGIINTAGVIDLAEAAVLVSGAGLHLGVDSFGGQLASAVGVKSLTIFGPTNPLLITFLGPRNVAVMKKTRCSPPTDRLYCCPDAGRSCKYLSCMRELETDHVLTVLIDLWEGRPVEEVTIF